MDPSVDFIRFLEWDAVRPPVGTDGEEILQGNKLYRNLRLTAMYESGEISSSRCDLLYLSAARCRAKRHRWLSCGCRPNITGALAPCGNFSNLCRRGTYGVICHTVYLAMLLRLPGMASTFRSGLDRHRFLFSIAFQTVHIRQEKNFWLTSSELNSMLAEASIGAVGGLAFVY